MGSEKKRGKKKGLGGLSVEKKKLLKTLIMQKAAEDLKRQQDKEAEEKRKFIDSRVPKLEIENLDKNTMEKTVKDLYSKLSLLEEEKYDLEIKLGRQEMEISELTIKLNDTKGKFVKPVLKKLSKPETKLQKLEKTQALKSKLGFRDQLKSTGQSKYALEEKEESKKPGWGQDTLKKKEGEAEDGEKNDELNEKSKAEDEEPEEE